MTAIAASKAALAEVIMTRVITKPACKPRANCLNLKGNLENQQPAAANGVLTCGPSRII
jgi:hypothetical protein